MNPEPSLPPENDGKPPKKNKYGSSFIEYHDGVLLHSGVALVWIGDEEIKVIDRLILSLCGIPFSEFPDGKETIIATYPDNGMMYSLNASVVGNWKDFNPEMDHPFSKESQERFWKVRKKVQDGVPPMEIYNEMVGNQRTESIIDTSAGEISPASPADSGLDDGYERPFLTYTGKGKFKKELSAGQPYPMYKENDTHVWVLNDKGEIESYPKTIFIDDEF